MNENPFDITKAVHYTNEQLLNYWVNLPGKSGFEDLINPRSQTPMIIKGSKGSGKTHVLKYYSFDLQKLRCIQSQGKLSAQIENDGYLGLYMRAGNLNSKKFRGKTNTDDAWQIIFEYYLDLFISQITLTVFKEILKHEPNLIHNEKLLCDKIIGLFDSWPSTQKKPNSISELVDVLADLQKSLDFQVNRSSLLGTSITDLSLLVSGGKLILGIPRIIKEEFQFLKDVQFSYLIDEYENFTFQQQKFINTLIREIEAPTSIKIGTRLYGIKTRETFSGGEIIRKGSEYEEIIIDQIFRDRQKDYSIFIKDICVSRIQKSGYSKVSSLKLKSAFEEFDNENLQAVLSKMKTLKHREKLIKSLPPLTSNEIIANNLIYSENLIIEKVSYLLFYRSWKKGENLVNASEKIKISRNEYLKNTENKSNSHYKVLDKFQYDLIDQLCKENQLPIIYWGIDNIIKMSGGIPRLVLLTLKYIFKWANYNGESPFLKDKISINSQKEGINEAANWFIEDARIPGKEGVTVKQTIHRIGQYLQTLRYSNIPPECSINAFKFDRSILSSQRDSILKYLIEYSYLISSNDRLDKNYKRRDETYHIIGVLAPIWGISINKRGVLDINSEIANCLFDEDPEGKDFSLLIASSKRKYNAPFNTSFTKSLF